MEGLAGPPDSGRSRGGVLRACTGLLLAGAGDVRDPGAEGCPRFARPPLRVAVCEQLERAGASTAGCCDDMHCLMQRERDEYWTETAYQVSDKAARWCST